MYTKPKTAIFIFDMLSDPNIFTKFILCIYCINSLWYCYNGLYGNAWYWFAAANITIAATWFMKY